MAESFDVSEPKRGIMSLVSIIVSIRREGEKGGEDVRSSLRIYAARRKERPWNGMEYGKTSLVSGFSDPGSRQGFISRYVDTVSSRRRLSNAAWFYPVRIPAPVKRDPLSLYQLYFFFRALSFSILRGTLAAIASIPLQAAFSHSPWPRLHFRAP